MRRGTLWAVLAAAVAFALIQAAQAAFWAATYVPWYIVLARAVFALLTVAVIYTCGELLRRDREEALAEEDADEYVEVLHQPSETEQAMTDHVGSLRFFLRGTQARTATASPVAVPEPAPFFPAPLSEPETSVSLTDVPGWDAQRKTATVASGDQQDAITHATTSGEPANPAGGPALPGCAAPLPPLPEPADVPARVGTSLPPSPGGDSTPVAAPSPVPPVTSPEAGAERIADKGDLLVYRIDLPTDVPSRGARGNPPPQACEVPETAGPAAAPPAGGSRPAPKRGAHRAPSRKPWAARKASEPQEVTP